MRSDTNKKSLEKAIPILKKLGAVNFCYLFGSMASGNLRNDSDIDLAIDLDKKPTAAKVLKISAELSNSLDHPVDLVFLRNCSPILQYQVLKNGQLLFETNTKAKNQFVVRTLQDYFDLKQCRKVVENALLKRFQ